MHDPSLDKLKALVLEVPTRSAELVADAPRLAHGVAELESDRRALLAAFDTHAVRCGNAAALDELVRRLQEYRQRAADLLYQAYTVDLGGET